MGQQFLREVFVLNSIRFKFERGEEVKYISHLDLAKVFERALRRSRIPIAYSQGFNPHPQMIFGLPLSVGVTSEAEYADFEFEEQLEVDDFMLRLNLQLPAGIRIVNAKVKETKTNIMASIAQASYEITISCSSSNEAEMVYRGIEALTLRDSIRVEKESKHGIKEIDIKPMIYKMAAKKQGCENLEVCISVLLSAGSESNLKPELIVKALGEIINKNIPIFNINRTGLFIEKDGRILEPMDTIVLI